MLSLIVALAELLARVDAAPCPSDLLNFPQRPVAVSHLDWLARLAADLEARGEWVDLQAVRWRQEVWNQLRACWEAAPHARAGQLHWLREKLGYQAYYEGRLP